MDKSSNFQILMAASMVGFLLNAIVPAQSIAMRRAQNERTFDNDADRLKAIIVKEKLLKERGYDKNNPYGPEIHKKAEADAEKIVKQLQGNPLSNELFLLGGKK